MSLPSRTILIIDDSPEDCELYRRYLQHDRNYTYTLLTAEFGRQGLGLWQHHQPDAVLLDYQLPDVDGLEVLTQFKSALAENYLPIIVVTGQGNEALAVETMKAGAQDYLVKGQITPERLQSAINSAIETTELRNQLQHSIERERLVARMTQKLHQSLDVAEIQQTAVTETREYLKTDRVLIFRLQAEGWGTIVAESVGAEWTALLSTSLHDPCLDEKFIEPFRQGLVTVKPDIYDGSVNPCHVELLANLQVRANLVMPIVQNDELWGMLIAQHCAAPRQWQPSEISLLKEIATQVGIALQQAELYQQLQQELAKRQRTESIIQQSKETVQQQLAEIESLYATAPVGLNVLDTDLRFVRINQRLAEINGFSVEDHIGRTMRELLPSVADSTEPLLRSIIETGEPRFDVEIQGETPAQPGVKRTWLEHFLPIKQGDRVIGISTVCEEITARKQVEADLATSEAKLKCFVDSNIVGIIMADLSGSIHEANDAFLSMLGYTREDLQSGNLRWQEITPSEWSEVDNWSITQIRETGSCQPFEKEYLHRDGTKIPVLIGVAMLPNSQETCFCFVLNVNDRVQVERDRERILQQEQAARSEAERANRIKDEFLAILSHELRSPLNPILGWTKLMQTRTFEPAEMATALETIERSVKVQIQLIDDLLDVAKILRGKLNMSLAPVNLLDIIQSATETVNASTQAKSIDLRLVAPPQIKPILGDTARLQQIVWNLLSNAIKFTPNQGQVEVRLEQVDDYARILVSDTGKGIKPDFLPHLFESFRQEDVSTTRKYGGLGLGLAIVRSLVEAHGGKIWADSLGEGQGATFTVQLPLLTAEVTAMPPEEPSALDLDLTGIRVLSVDDDPDIRDLLTAVLMQSGAEALTVASAAEALATLETFQPNILVSDIGMPNMDGYTLLHQIRSLPSQQGKELPAIALTAYARTEDQQRALQEGFQQHLSKPIEPAQLIQAIARCVGQN